MKFWRPQTFFSQIWGGLDIANYANYQYDCFFATNHYGCGIKTIIWCA